MPDAGLQAAVVRDPGPFAFAVRAREPGTRARLGRLTTPHGSLDTPNFVFCATKAAIKGATPQQMADAGTDIILANTYHLMVQPGADLIERLGGLHRFMNWPGPLLTDSGGFQIFSMGHGQIADEIKGRRGQNRETTLIRVAEEGAEFRSYRDGSRLFLSPEGSMAIQRQLGADLIMQFDECTPFHVDRAYTARSMALSHRWGDRCLAEFARHDDGRQALYGIIQGGVYADLRRESAAWTASRPFFGTAVGGSLGADKAQMYGVVAMALAAAHPDRPVHLLGIGGVRDILEGVRLGVDTFDCVGPTRIARHGWALLPGVADERVNLRNARFRDDPNPLDPACPCPACRDVSAAYLHHLLKAEELLGLQLLTLHNVATMTRLLRDIRAGIAAGTLDEVRGRWLAG